MRRKESQLGALLLLLAASSATADDDVLLVRLEGFEPGQSRAARFTLQDELKARIDGIGAGSTGSLYAYGFLIRLDDQKLVWSMEDAYPETEREDTRSLVFRQDLTLPAGSYLLGYYRATSRHEASGRISLKTLFAQRREDPGQWYVSLRSSERGAELFAPIPTDDSAARSADQVRLAPIGNEELLRERFRLTRPSEVRIHALGEAFPGRPSELADRSWLVDLKTRKRLWAMEGSATRHAGGALKNRQVDLLLKLEAGAYELVAATDDSHAYGSWNSLPPHQPDDWGVTLSAPPGALDREGLPVERSIARLTGIEDNERVSLEFRLDAPAAIRVYAFGEWGSRGGELADQGWIEDARTGASVWRMDYAASAYAGGASKNRVVDTSIDLPAGSYRVVYETDDSHAAGDWNSSPPNDPHSWGISLSTFDEKLRFEVKAWDATPLVERHAPVEPEQPPSPPRPR